jgi:3-hydroxymyristoyl/3-hydroxydecanoyl-(acyl carrier protein) dehydratase
MDYLIEKHLHHKKPNLLLEHILECTEDRLKASFYLSEEHPLIKGHFPGLPILPGTQMMEMLIQSAGLHMAETYYPNHREEKMAVGVFRRCSQAKFQNFGRPNQDITSCVKHTESVGNLHTYSGRVVNAKGEKLMQAKFSLVTILETTLGGHSHHWSSF